MLQTQNNNIVKIYFFIIFLIYSPYLDLVALKICITSVSLIKMSILNAADRLTIGSVVRIKSGSAVDPQIA